LGLLLNYAASILLIEVAPLSLKLVVVPGSFFNGMVWVNLLSLAILAAVLPLANVVCAILSDETAVSVPLAIAPLTFVNTSTFVNKPSNSVGLFFLVELSNILREVVQVHSPVD